MFRKCLFYFHQLWTYEFCVHNVKNEKATFYSYREGQALEGPKEVTSYLNYYYIHANIPEKIMKFYLLCDGCPGQNKNNAMIKFLLEYTATRNMKKKISAKSPLFFTIEILRQLSAK